MVRFNLHSGLFAALVMLAPLSSGAVERPDGPCKADADKLCQNVERGHGAVARCLKQHEASLSAECREAVTRSEQKVKALSKACKEDTQQFCRRVNPGRGRVLKCLKDNEAKLSEACRSALPEKAHEKRE